MGKKTKVTGNGEVSKEIVAACAASQPECPILIACDDIVPSPYNKTPRMQSIDELADNIKANGLIHPVVVRSVSPTDNEYELVCGERRWRAFKLLGQPVPAFVRAYTDAQAMRINFIENNQRKDKTPMEDAANIQMMIDAGSTIEQIANDLNMSVSRAARRASLVRLSDKWRKAIADPKKSLSNFGASHLELITRFEPAIQDEILQEVCGYRYEDEMLTVSELEDICDSQFMNILSGAPWKADWPCSMGACKDCQKRSGAQQMLNLFGETDGKKVADRCLDAACWKAKYKEFIEQRAAELKVQNPDIVFVTGYSDTYLDKKHDLKKNALDYYRVSEVSKKDKNAVQAYIVDGSKGGHVTYIRKPGKSASSGSVGGSIGGSTGPKTMKEKEQGLLKRRILALFVKVDCLLIDIGDHPEKHAEKFNCLNKLLSLALTFGLKPDGEDRFMDAVQQWKNREKLDDALECSDGRDINERILRQVLPIIREETRNVGYVSDGADRERKLLNEIGKFFGFDIDNLFKTVCEEIKEPKSWATERLKESLAKKVSEKKKSAE